ncbi:unnamed protein product [Schistosoma bovis]|nr:unnamed protein product [Schistosoma bovis]
MERPLPFSRSKLPKSKHRFVSWSVKQKQKKFNQALPVNRSNVPFNCPLIGCSGIGHINGRDTAHVTLSGCPLYHNMSFVKWAEMRAREEGLVVPESIIRISQNSQSPSKVKHRVDRSHQFKTTQREPMLDDLASQVELYQFRRAQQRLVSTYETDAREHLLLCARVASNSGNVPNNGSL